jgi:hypothetical protein
MRCHPQTVPPRGHVGTNIYFCFTTFSHKWAGARSMTDHLFLWIPSVLPAPDGSTARKYVNVAAANLCMKRSGTLAFVLRVDNT